MLLVPLKTSKIESLSVLCIHCAALFALTLSSLSLALSWLLALLLVCSLVRSRAVLFSNVSQTPLRIEIGSQHCVLTYPKAQHYTTLPQVLVCSEWLILLRFHVLDLAGSQPLPRRRKRKQFIVSLLPDSLETDADRQLRCYLRFQCPTTKD